MGSEDRGLFDSRSELFQFLIPAVSCESSWDRFLGDRDLQAPGLHLGGLSSPCWVYLAPLV